MKKLTPKRAAFVAEYMIDKNATQAAIRAGYSAKTAASIGEEILRKPEIRAAINAALSRIIDGLEVSASRNLREHARLAYYDIGAIAAANIKRPADIAKLPEDLRRCITGWKWDSEGRFVLQFADKNPHLTALDKHLGLYDKDNRQKGDAVARAVQEFFQSIYGDRNKLPIAADH